MARRHRPSSIRFVSSYVSPDVLRAHVALFQRPAKWRCDRPSTESVLGDVFMVGIVLKRQRVEVKVHVPKCGARFCRHSIHKE